MKKVVIIFISILLCVSIALTVFSIIKLDDEKKEIKKINNNISKITKKIENTEIDSEKYKKEIEELNIELSEKIEEEEIWKETKEKLNQALSQ